MKFTNDTSACIRGLWYKRHREKPWLVKLTSTHARISVNACVMTSDYAQIIIILSWPWGIAKHELRLKKSVCACAQTDLILRSSYRSYTIFPDMPCIWAYLPSGMMDIINALWMIIVCLGMTVSFTIDMVFVGFIIFFIHKPLSLLLLLNML